MIINEIQLQTIADIVTKYNIGCCDAKFYFFQDEEMMDTSISIHIHCIDSVEIINVDVYGDCVYKGWF